MAGTAAIVWATLGGRCATTVTMLDEENDGIEALAAETGVLVDGGSCGILAVV
jgi:hypothetical protein